MSSPDDYVKHQLNTSPTKESHSFSKEPRFPRSQKLVTEAIYKLPSTSTKRATTFGYGEKTQLSQKKTLPPPGSYRLKSDFDGKDLGNVASIGVGREKVTFGSFLLQALKRNKYVPSPDRYDPIVQKSWVGGRMGGRIKTDMDLKQKSSIPGPGTYKLTAVQLGNSGHYVLSNYKNSKPPRYFNTSVIDRAKISSTQRNGQSIEEKECLEQQVGRYANSRFRNVPVRSFGHGVRPGLQERASLGIPGFKYRRFSQFGSFS